VPVLEQREQQHEPSQAGLGPTQSGSSQQQAAGPSGAAAAAAAAQVLLGVQLGPAGSLGELQQVPEYDSDFELWVGALHKSSHSEGGEFVAGRCLELRTRGSLCGHRATVCGSPWACGCKTPEAYRQIMTAAVTVLVDPLVVLHTNLQLQRTSQVPSWLMACRAWLTWLCCWLVGRTQGARPLVRHERRSVVRGRRVRWRTHPRLDHQPRWRGGIGSTAAATVRGEWWGEGGRSRGLSCMGKHTPLHVRARVGYGFPGSSAGGMRCRPQAVLFDQIVRLNFLYAEPEVSMARQAARQLPPLMHN
jgi:hypothetical protein